MLNESKIRDEVQGYIDHPVYPGSFMAMESVLDDIERYTQAGIITNEVRQELADMIMNSHHFGLLTTSTRKRD